MRNVTFELSNVHQHGSSFYDYLALRKQFFVDTLKWQIPHNADVEMDQYDNLIVEFVAAARAETPGLRRRIDGRSLYQR